MNYRLFIAWRYLFSRKSHHAINIISAISACGVAVASLAMVCTLSVFNGFQGLVADLFTDFDPQLKVTLAQGRTIRANDPALIALRQRPDVEVATDCLEDQALVVRDGKQIVVTIKGVDDTFSSQVNTEKILYPETEEPLVLHADVLEYGLVGVQLAVQLGLQADFSTPLQIYAPKRGERVNMANPMSSFNADELYSPGAVFIVKQAKYDAHYIVTSIDFARRLFDKQGQISQVELRMKSGVNISRAQRDISRQLGPRFVVQNRYEQQEDIFRIMKIEKFIAFLFLTFILLVASFNIVGSLTMLMIDKKSDITTLRNLGAKRTDVQRIFIIEGNMISILGAIIGIAIGVILCTVQQHFGIVGMGKSEGAFIVEAYPVEVNVLDILLIFLTVVFVSALVVWYPVKRLVDDI